MRETSERQNRSLNIIILIHRIRLISGSQPAFLIEHVDDDIQLMEWGGERTGSALDRQIRAEMKE